MAFVRKHGFKLAILALCAVMAGYLFWSSREAEKLPVIKAAPGYTFTGLDGKPATLDESGGKVRLYYFFFANCPDVCPPTTVLAKDVQNALKEQGNLGTDVTFHWITIDPQRDTADKMKAYAERFKLDLDGWEFLRGEPKETVSTAFEFGLMIQNEGGPEKLVHQDKLILVDREGQIRKYISGSGEETMSSEQILSDINKLLKE